MNEEKVVPCPICKSNAFPKVDYNKARVLYCCPVCGRFEVDALEHSRLNLNHMGPYLLYHRYPDTDYEYRYHTTLGKDECDEYRKELEDDGRGHIIPVHMDSDLIDNWYPRTFAERVDNILLYVNKCTPHIGKEVSWSFQEAISALFIDRYDIDANNHNKREMRDETDLEDEVRYMLDCLKNSSFIEYTPGPSEEESFILKLTPTGYTRIDELQKYSSRGHSAFVAMKFGDETIPLREAIRKGVKEAGYNAILIDEVQHNDFITPELLKCIRDSKFVIADLTHQNNGAYFEEGYAMGLGKPVIQLCKKGTILHFDIAQKNTIIWRTEDDLPDLLYNRIKATIDD